MALATVSKINIIAHQKHQEDFLEVLQNLGLTQLVDYAEEGLEKNNLNEKLADLDYKLAGIKFSLEFLSQYVTEKKSLAERFSKIDLNLAEFERTIKEFDLEKKVKIVQEIESGINESNNLKEKLNLELNQITPWQKLNFAPTKQEQTNFDFKFISAPVDKYHDLIKKIEKELLLTTTERVDETDEKKKEILAVIFFQTSEEQKIIELLTTENIKIVELPNLNVTISERIKEINKQLSETDDKTEKIIKEAEAKANDQQNLKIAYDFYNWRKEKLVNQQKAGQTWQTFSLIGWIDRDLIKILEKELNKITDDFVVEKLLIDDDESVPVIFKNKLVKDFESITNLYGVPQSHEPDPTPFLAPFFILFFGMAMTDAGYGLIMALGILGAIKFLKIPRKKQKLLRVLMWGGVATFILGALTGGWFSIELSILPAIIAGPLKAIKIIDPIENPLLIFYISLGLGVFQVLTGLTIDTYWKIKSNKMLDGIFGSGAWLLTIISLLILSGGSMGILPSAFGQIGKWLVILGVLMIVYGGTRSTKNVFLKPGFGILSLYGAVGYFSDILSYSRLLALGLTTTIIGTVVNIIAGLVFTIPYVGWLAGLVILIGGHAFNLAINALGAFIHSARLQFIEFFPKFLEAGGEPFEPFQKEAKYINLTK